MVFLIKPVASVSGAIALPPQVMAARSLALVVQEVPLFNMVKITSAVAREEPQEPVSF